MPIEKEVFTIAIAGNPNCGKTALFNSLTGSNQIVGNWPGVTVEKKEGQFKLDNHTIRVVDLPGIYALFANSEDERAALDYLLKGEADLVVNILDATNLERNLFLTSQLIPHEPADGKGRADGLGGEHDGHRGEPRHPCGPAQARRNPRRDGDWPHGGFAQELRRIRERLAQAAA